jgi:cullin 1
MEGMVTDLQLAREGQTPFDEWLAEREGKKPGIDITVTVLTTGFWPTYKFIELSLPQEMVNGVEVSHNLVISTKKSLSLTLEKETLL